MQKRVENRRTTIRAEVDAYCAHLYGLTRDELRYILDPADVCDPDFPSETFCVLKVKEVKEYGECRTQRLVLEAWDAQQVASDSGQLPWDHPDPGPSVVSPNAQPAPAVIVESHSADRPEPAKSQTKAKPSTTPKAEKSVSAKPAEQLALPQVHLPDLSLASEGAFSQRLKRVQKLGKQSSSSFTAELTVYLTAPDSSLRWLASSSLVQRASADVVSAIAAFLDKAEPERVERARPEAKRVMGLIADTAEDDEVRKMAQQAREPQGDWN